jgi:hypothetical protein
MKKSLLADLRCPGCRQAYRAFALVEDPLAIDLGYLWCECGSAVIPILAGFVFFTEPLLHRSLADAAALHALTSRVFGAKQDFDRVAEEKMKRGVVEAYAAFQPFNESSRALEPLLPILKAAVRPGDLLLDTWCRTGWTGEWLAGNFPEQRVVSMWEGNSSVLGYRGFRHLLGSERRAPNLDLIFAQASGPLPFADGCVALLHGHDALHRHALYPFAAEALRVSRDGAPLVFPHVHLSNSEPEPYFDRGGRILHGTDYRRWLDGLALGARRRGYVFSEAALFERSLAPSPAPFVDDSETTHYNGLVAVLPENAPSVDSADSTRRFLVNPLCHFDLSRSSVRVARDAFHGEVGKLLCRHPVYAKRLPQQALALDEASCLALLLSASGLDEAAILRTASAAAGMSAAVTRLEANEVILGARVSKNCHDLQRYHAHQWVSGDPSQFTRWLSPHVGGDNELMILPDGEALSAGDAVEYLARVPNALRAFDVASGDWLCIRTLKHPLLALCACAAAASGINVSIGSGATAVHELHAFDPETTATTPRSSAATDVDAFLAAALRAEPVSLDALDARGLVDLPLGAGRMRCTFADLVSGTSVLGGQLVQRLLVVDEGTTAWQDLTCVMISLLTGEVLRA